MRCRRRSSKVWRNLPVLRQPEAFDGWGHQILVRRCYALLRRHRRQRIVTIRALDMDAPAPSEEHRVDAREQIDHAFGRLTPEQRAVRVLHHRVGRLPR